MKKRKQCQLTSILTITVPMHNVDLQALFSVTALLKLVFSLMPQAVFVFPPDESLEQGQNRSQMLTCLIPVML